MSTFKPDRALLNPKFDGYKLAPLSQEEAVSRFPLPFKLSQTNVSGRSYVTFQEVQSRISHNHLALSPDGTAVYVDGDLRVVCVRLDEATLVPSFHPVCELPKSVESPETQSLQREYPSAAFLDSSSLFVADGHGLLYALRIVSSAPAEISGTFKLSIPAIYGSSQAVVPFRIHQAALPTPQKAILILSSKYYPQDTNADQLNGSSRGHMKAAAEFDIWAVQFDLPLPSSSNTPLALDILWHRRGQDVPVYTTFDAVRESFMLVGGSSYRPIGVVAAPLYEPSPDEIAPIPRAGENLDAAQSQKPPPYSWTQTTDSVTVAIPLPSSTQKENIRASFSPHTLTLFVRGDPSLSDRESDNLTHVKLPRYDMKTLWDGIQPSTSFWTWDREAEHRYGVLTLHLDKAHEGTRWAQVFAAAGTRPAASSVENTSDEDIEVSETLDPSELWAIRESLEKYTAALRDGTDTSGLGLGSGVPSLGKDEMDDEVDLGVGRTVYLTWVRMDGSRPLYDHSDDAPVHLLSTPFPGVDWKGPPALVVKNGLDGVLYELCPGSNADDAPAWAHTSTYSALSFVLASKRDTRFTHHVSSHAVFAFESGSLDLGGNVYIYRGIAPQEKWAKQAVLKVGGGSAGSLLGIGLQQMSESKTAILCLCEGEMIVLHDVL
ncbi:uncharacterized protein FIBRA_05670 [Fibroporia radiculosa]|uniref:NudC domain-containing protein 1 n=1 Tax=Fibroporia radiculosa TaxID=599839 RepID=J4IAU8_9APHY|nr:uncharacterized protein FIBRA_05670 [Fibroporia radiculosa]CCM03536.1 predicted protein [Fibroporia radiculosa]